MFRKLYAFLYVYLTNTAGSTGIEYSLIASSVGGAMVTGYFVFGQDVAEVLGRFTSFVGADEVSMR